MTIALLLLAAVGGGLWAATCTIAYTDYEFVCENSGSRKGHREWVFGLQTTNWYRPSELERFMQSQPPSMFMNRWTSYRGDGRSLIPCVKSFGHGSPGPIILIRPEQLDRYVTSISAERRLELYRLFASADEAAIETEIGAIVLGKTEEKKAAEPGATDPDDAQRI